MNGMMTAGANDWWGAATATTSGGTISISTISTISTAATTFYTGSIQPMTYRVAPSRPQQVEVPPNFNKFINASDMLKEFIAFAVAFVICWRWDFDAVSMIVLTDETTRVGEAVTAAVIAGGSKGSIKLFRDWLKFRSSAWVDVQCEKGRMTREEAGRPAAAESSAPSSSPGKKTGKKTPRSGDEGRSDD